MTSHDSAATVLPTGFLVDLNLDMSTPDTYRPPPAPIPYDVVMGHPESIDSESPRETFDGSGNENFSAYLDLKESGYRTETSFILPSRKKFELELNEPASEEEDVCPTCLEGILLAKFQ